MQTKKKIENDIKKIDNNIIQCYVFNIIHNDIINKEVAMNIMTVRPPEKLKAELKEYAKENGLTINTCVTLALREYLENQRKRKQKGE